MPRLPNDLWCADYKGEFMLADRPYCYPLTITDFASRYQLIGDHCSGSQGQVQSRQDDVHGTLERYQPDPISTTEPTRTIRSGV